MNHPRADKFQEIRTRWFKDHVATVKTCENGLILIEWKAPKTGCYAIRYIIHGGTLFVYGDLGAAVYQWSGKVSIEFIAQTELGYFAGKCEASEKGRGRDCYDFSFEEFVKSLKETIAEEPESYRGLDLDSLEYCEPDEHGAIGWLRDQSELDGETMGMLLSAGKTMDLRMVSHWVGMQMAEAQLKQPAAKPNEGQG